MPPSKRKQQLAALEANRAEKQDALSSETSVNELWSSLQSAKKHITELEAQLALKNEECSKLQSSLNKCQEKLAKSQEKSTNLEEKQKNTYHELRMQRQTTKRGQKKLAQLEAQVEILKSAEKEATLHHRHGSRQSAQALDVLKKENEGLQSELSKSMTCWTAQLDKAYSKLSASADEIKVLCRHACKLLKKDIWNKEASKQATKGVFTEETQNVVRLEVITTVLKSAGITAVGTISRPSVTCILREGYYAAQVQLGYEMKNTQTMTFSADGTSHRSVNYNSQHSHLLVEDYSLPDSNTKQRVTRTFGIKSSQDGSSEEAIADWEESLKKIAEIYNNRMNTDHCAKEKKDARMLEDLKAWAVDQNLGEDQMLEMSPEEVSDYFRKAEQKMIKKAGGQRKWESLSESKRAERKANMIEEAVAELGREAFEQLSNEEQCFLWLFIWAGCGCHKDLNTVHGGYLAMLKWWDENEIVQEREAALAKGDTPTPAQERAFSKSTRGAIKTAELAGAIFNHKNDKIGHHDIFRFWWWQHVGVPFTFPDVSNNQFQSFCDAAAALILHLDDFLAFLESLHANKYKPTLNHMKTNLKNVLECSKTSSELAVLAITAEAISYPYMKAIRASSDKNQNMLDLGPLHSKVYDHIQKIIVDPDILIGTDADYRAATLNSEEWENSAVVAKILDIAPELPPFHELLVAFLNGALETWERFTSEFAPRGLIDEATMEERELAWMPATNDENEGALGSFCHLM
ncbi:hypothetical protein CPB84DRAFT_1854232 [Gymnopilus junonius]|uniref:Uncharacterized protein n=1 Tax=Gymnopilus junonius TaxID=109634 RepID=A0A9P5TGC8_GYMJU|nr:hypothetical protein CPB84DRAFT_1854232 [Gymnopilus junonius]